MRLFSLCAIFNGILTIKLTSLYKVDLGTKKNSTPNKNRTHFKFFVFLSILLLSSFLLLNNEREFTRGSKIIAKGTSEVLGVIESSAAVIEDAVTPELKNENGLTSALLVGIDTRDVEFKDGEFISTSPQGQAGTRNTDTIIQVVFDKSKDQVYMISLPRDLGVDVRKDCLEFHGSIHWVYDKAQSAGCPGGGVEVLKETVENVTGIKVQYHGFVTLDAFLEVIETIGEKNKETGEKGIYINNPENLYESYPIDDYSYQSVYFPQGEQFLSPQRALIYVRSRQYTSDFGRAERQQILLDALKDRALSKSTFLNPKKIISILNTFQDKTIFSEPSLQEILASIEVIKKVAGNDSVNIILSPDLGGREVFINKQPHDRRGGPYYMVPTKWAQCTNNEYCHVKKLISNIIEDPDTYNEASTLSVVHTENSSSVDSRYTTIDNFALPLTTKIRNRLVYSSSIPEIKSRELIIVDFSKGSKPSTKQHLKSKFNTTTVSGSKYPNLQGLGSDFVVVLN